MKIRTYLFVGVCGAVLSVVSRSYAADSIASTKVVTQELPTPVYLVYDTNRNGFLEEGEVNVIKKAYRQDINSKLLKPYDTNKDEELSTQEIAAIRRSTTIEVVAAASPTLTQTAADNNSKKMKLPLGSALSSTNGGWAATRHYKGVVVTPRRRYNRYDRYNRNRW